MKRRKTLICALMLMVFVSGCGGAGDRVLVSKCYYDLLPGDPRRHDIVVFRFPDQPVKNGTPTNYIKRLIGLAGETIAVFFGQLFYATALSYDDDKNMLAGSKDKYRLSVDKMHNVHQNDQHALELFKQGKFKIIRKRPATMLAMRRIVYDNDYQANDLIGVLPRRWSAESGSKWNADSKNHKMFSHSGQTDQVDWLRYQHIIRPSDWPKTSDFDPQGLEYKARVSEIKNRKHKPGLITDFSGYNSYESADPRDPRRPRSKTHGHPPQNWVGDLMVEVQVKVEKSQGEFYLELARGVDRFQARWSLQYGTCTLVRLQDGAKEQVLDTKKTSVAAPGTYSLRFANFDERLTVWVSRKLPFGDGVVYKQAWYWDKNEEKFVNVGPNKNDLKPVSIGSKGAAIKVSHLRIWRDTFYTVPDVAAHRELEFWQDPDKWGALSNAPLENLLLTIYVQKNHYLCMGDNSPESYDGRSWGLVPKRLLLGRALMVYWPETRIGTIIH